MDEETLIIIAIGFVGLVVGFYLLKYLYFGAVGLFEWASEQGFVGVAAYFACWFFMFPLMIVACIIVGAIYCWSDNY